MQLRHNAKMHRFLASSVSALLAANVMVLVVGLADDVADSNGATRTVTLVTTEDGRQVEVDPSTPEGQWMIAEAEQRGDEVVTVPAAQAGTTTTVPGATTTSVPAAEAGDDELVPGVTVPPVVGEVRDTVEDTVNQVTDTVDDTTEQVGGTVDETVDDVTDVVDDTAGTDTGETVDPVVDETTDTVVDTVDEVTDVVDDTADDVLDVVDDDGDDDDGGLIGGLGGSGL